MTVLALPLLKATQVSLSFFPSMFFVGCKLNNQPHLMYLLICGLPSYFPMNSLHCSFPNLLFSPMFPSPSILPCLEVAICHSPGVELKVAAVILCNLPRSFSGTLIILFAGLWTIHCWDVLRREH